MAEFDNSAAKQLCTNIEAGSFADLGKFCRSVANKVGGIDGRNVISTNISFGHQALMGATTGANNTAIGYQSLKAVTTGVRNTAVGALALDLATIATGSTAVGYDALGAVTTGINNTAIGNAAGNNVTTGTGNTVVGAGSTVSAAGAVDQIVLGRAVTGVANAAITLGNGTRAITCNYDTDQTWDAPSDMRMKNLIGESALGLKFICAITPVEYTFKPASEWPAEWGVDPDAVVNTETPILGLFAQDVKAAMDLCGETTFHGHYVGPTGQQGIGESAFVYPLINAVKELAAKVAALEGKKA